MKARRHERSGDVGEINERLRRRSARLNDAEAARLERAIARQGQEGIARAAGISLVSLDDARHSGPSTPTTIAALRGFLSGLP